MWLQPRYAEEGEGEVSDFSEDELQPTIKKLSIING